MEFLRFFELFGIFDIFGIFKIFGIIGIFEIFWTFLDFWDFLVLEIFGMVFWIFWIFWDFWDPFFPFLPHVCGWCIELEPAFSHYSQSMWTLMRWDRWVGGILLATSWPNLKVKTFQIFSWAEILSWAECGKKIPVSFKISFSFLNSPFPSSPFPVGGGRHQNWIPHTNTVECSKGHL